MRVQSFGGVQLVPGEVLFEWDRPFSVWGYSGSHSRLLLRSVKQESPGSRIDVLFKPVHALFLNRLALGSLLVRVATVEVAEEILRRAPSRHPQDVLELVGPDGVPNHVVCLGVAYCVDDGDDWEPSVFADDFSDGRTPVWRLGVLGGGPDGELTARYASVEDLAMALRADPPPAATGQKGRWLSLVLARSLDDDSRPRAVAAFLTRYEAEQHAHDLHQRHGGRTGYWVDSVPIDL